ncbi:mannose-6-phosphate isomerase, partial [[Ruminococcus] gnavus]|nr:mannose-6-phosphate isomerase [Mediterraneibacter gnavus]
LLNVLIKKLTPAHVILSEDIFYDGKKLTEMMQVNLTEDRVRGVMYYGTIRDYVDEAKLAKIQKFVKNKEGIVLV